MFESPDCQVIREAFEQFYQSRSQLQTQRVFDVIRQAFPQATHQKVKLYSFFADIVESPQDLYKIQLNSPLYLLQRNQQDTFTKYEILHKIDLAKFDLSKFTLCIPPESKIKCEMINSIDDEIKWLQNNQYLGDLQKKRLYHLIRNAEMLSYTFNNNVYSEGDILQPGHACLFLVKQGEFCFKKNKNVMLYNFGGGEVFGHEELLSEDEHKKRLFTVSCRSSYGVIFKISEEFFNYYLKKNCEQNLKLNIESVSKFIGKQIEKVQTSRQKNQLLLAQNLSFRKPLSNQKNDFASVPKLLKSSRTALQGVVVEQKASKEQKLPFISVKSQLGLNNLVKRQRISLSNPEYQQDAKIINKKIKLQVLKNYTKGKTTESRGEILLNLIKNSWHFERNRKKKILINN